ncbi:MAG TPA: carboxypeptidase regulatory-like domain-containing protein [Bryobacteraceae bacterium]|nr:carboxypeptidase regulatory-like domain-containing protein [Bryobacteraceae bacterium]
MRSIALLLVIGACLEAQTALTSATLGGKLEDGSGSAVSGAQVEAQDLSRGRKHVIKSDQEGRFQFLHLSPGDYLIVVSDPRFQTLQRSISVTVGQAFNVQFQLAVAGRQDSVEVEDKIEALEAARTQASQTITTRAIDNLPLNGRNYLDLALLAPGVSRANIGAPQQFAETSAVPGSGVSVSGQRNLNNTFIVDGLSANDDAADLAGTAFSQEVIREFQIVTAGGTAEFGRASSGAVNIVTRSGSNDWHGRGYGFLRNQRMDARHPLASSKDPLTQTQYGASAGGPIREDRDFIFANFEQGRRNAAGFVTITPTNVSAINAAMDSLGYPGPRITTGQFPTGWDTTNVFIKTDHNFTDRQQLNVRFNLYDIASDNARSVGGLSDVSRGTRLDNRDYTIAASHVVTPSARDLIENRLQFTRSRLSAPGNDLIGPAVNIAGAANFGASTTSPTGRFNDLYEWSGAASLHRGSHVWKIGGNILLNRLNILFPGSQLAPVYAFSSTALFVTGRYQTFQQAFGGPEQFQSNPNFAFFLQDEWKPTRNLTLNLGVRYDIQKLPSPIQTDRNNLSPRFGIAWAPGKRDTVVRASYGLYYDRTPLRATSNALQRDGSKYRVALLGFGQPGAPVFPQRLAAFPEGQYINITTIDPNIENSYTHQASFEIERQITTGTTISAGYQWVRALHLILSRNVNVPTLTAQEANAAGIPNLGRPDSRYGNVSRYEGSGDSYFNGLLVSARSRFSRSAELQVAYTLSKAIDNVTNNFFGSPQDNSNLRDDRSLSDNDQRHRLTIAGVLDSPWKSWLLSDWQLSPMFRYTSALPYNVLLNYDRNNDTSQNDRPVGLGRNTARGFNYVSLDVRVSRTIVLSEQVRLQVMAESFNTLNRSNMAVPNNVIGTGLGPPLPSFGRATATFDPRQLQMGLRLSF